MPVQTCTFNPVRKLPWCGVPECTPGKQKIQIHNDSAYDVKTVKTSHGEIYCVEIVRGRGYAKVKLVRVFKILDDQEHK